LAAPHTHKKTKVRLGARNISARVKSGGDQRKRSRFLIASQNPAIREALQRRGGETGSCLPRELRGARRRGQRDAGLRRRRPSEVLSEREDRVLFSAPAGSPPRDQAAYHGLSLANVAKQGLAVASGIMPSFAAGGHPLSYGPASRALSPASPKNAALCQSNSPAHQPNGVAAQSPARRSVNGNPVEVPHSVGAPWDIERKEGEVEVLTQVAGFTAPQRPTTCGAVDGCRVASNGSSVYGPGSPGSTSTIARAGTTQELRSYPSGQQAYAFPAAVAPQPQANDQFARYYVFDWDNTLCPTDWLCELYGRNGMNLYLSKKPCQALQSPALKPKLDLLQNTVRKLLLKCRDKGEIAIMSNATTVGLIKTLRLLPVIHRTVNEL
ncbi:hypothetical protein CSUI_008054, partial [Cystoisospora suis]